MVVVVVVVVGGVVGVPSVVGVCVSSVEFCSVTLAVEAVVVTQASSTNQMGTKEKPNHCH